MCIQGSYRNLLFLIQDSYSSTFTALEVLKNESKLSKNKAWRPPFGYISDYHQIFTVKGCTLWAHMQVRSKDSKRGIDVVAFSKADLKGETYKGLMLADLRNSEINFRKENYA